MHRSLSSFLYGSNVFVMRASNALGRADRPFDQGVFMSYSIIGSGSVGAAIASQFARSGITVGIANTRGPDSIAAMASALGDKIVPLSLKEALEADVIILAVPFRAHRDVAQASANWKGKVVVDATNAYGVPLSELDNLPSSAIVAKAFRDASLVKAFNHLPAKVLAENPVSAGGRRVLFLSGDDEAAIATVATLVERLGYSAVSLGKIAEGGQLVQARDKSWAPLIFQDLFKKEQ
jgi:8-hydroxy-5-deazaflavin:NADPH oxidoreductase